MNGSARLRKVPELTRGIGGSGLADQDASVSLVEARWQKPWVPVNRTGERPGWRQSVAFGQNGESARRGSTGTSVPGEPNESHGESADQQANPSSECHVGCSKSTRKYGEATGAPQPVCDWTHDRET
jgi:hypothetical protein